MIDASPEQLRLVQTVIERTLPPKTVVWAFGSRAYGRAKAFSDLDLAVDAGRKLTLKELAALDHDFETSSLPWKVDVLDLHNVAAGFRESIEGQLVPLTSKGDLGLA